MVTCFDTLNAGDSDDQGISANKTATRNIHIAFVGDSRMRQIFGNIIQVNFVAKFIRIKKKFKGIFSFFQI